MEVKFISVNKIARTGGVLYLIIILTGIFGEIFARGKLIVSGDATATANNIISSQLIWRIGIAGDLIMHVCDVGLMVILYYLLRPVNKYLALLALLFTLVQTAVLVATKLNLFTTLLLLGDANYLKALEPNQLYALAYVTIKNDSYGFGIGLLFFGFTCLVNGYLIIRSDYFPKLIGVLLQIAGLCYITNSMAMIIAPKFADMLFPFILLPSFIAELSFCLWLIVKGVREEEWKRKATSLVSL
jgi:hypothetical protein